MLAVEHDSEYLYPDLAEKYINDSASIGKEIKKFYEDIGIKDVSQEIDGYERKVSIKDIHSFRHTFVYIAAVHGIPFPIVQSIVGHASPAMTKIYMDHAARSDKARYFEQLPEYLSTTKKLRAPRELTRERVARILSRITPENLEKSKQRITALLLK